MNFFRHVIRDLKKTGAVAPSSKILAQKLVDQLSTDITCHGCPPLNILELGPGTGPLTKQIVKLLRPADHLDVVEIQEAFYRQIKARFDEKNISVYLGDILTFKAEHSYDFIFSSLPYENMSPRVSRDIWEKQLALCSEHSYICYFKYVQFRNFKCDFEEQIVNKYKQSKEIVLLNLPPAKIYTLQIDKPQGAQNILANTA